MSNPRPMRLPHRANTLRAIAASMANRELMRATQRQAVSDKIGYAVAVVMGAAAWRYGGRLWVAVLCAGYVFNAWMAHRKWQRLTKQ